MKVGVLFIQLLINNHLVAVDRRSNSLTVLLGSSYLKRLHYLSRLPG